MNTRNRDVIQVRNRWVETRDGHGDYYPEACWNDGPWISHADIVEPHRHIAKAAWVLVETIGADTRQRAGTVFEITVVRAELP